LQNCARRTFDVRRVAQPATEAESLDELSECHHGTGATRQQRRLRDVTETHSFVEETIRNVFVMSKESVSD
jgi:hypothetical protein